MLASSLDVLSKRRQIGCDLRTLSISTIDLTKGQERLRVGVNLED